MPKARQKRGGPRPGAGQLTLEQALSRAVCQRDLPETDSDEPEDTFSSSTEHDDRDVEWRPPGPKNRAGLESSEDETEDEGDEEEGAPPTMTRHARVVSSEEAGKSRREDPPSWRDMADWSPKVLPFTAVPGPRNAAGSLQSDKPADFLELFICDELLLLIVAQTNKYAEQCFAVLDDAVLPEYSSVDVALETPYFRKTMSRNRYQLIWRFLHFSDNREFDGSDRLHKVRLVLDLLLTKFREMYQPSQNISVDEGMLLWRGRLCFRVYSPAKPIKYGIKNYILCDSTNGYCYSMKPYCGTYSTLQDTVSFLIDGLEGFGYRLWMDNFYNSESMCRLLLSLQMHSAGTLRVNRGEPPSIRQVTTRDLAVGERVARHNDAVMVLAWRDKRIVRMISTFHQDEMITVEVRQKGHGERVPQRKPACVVQYNQHMSGVDRLDQKISYYPFVRKTAKWSSKSVAYLLQIAMSNAFILYRKRNPTTSCKTLKNFTLSVVKSWTEACPPPAPPCPPPPLAADGQTPVHPRKRSLSARLDVDFAGHVALQVEAGTKKTTYRKCAHCKGRGLRKETKYVCPRCDHIPLCLYSCYFEYHSQ
ncbi:piggyBac transposable element-derived protein 4-like [Diretmus argenteus]